MALNEELLSGKKVRLFPSHHISSDGEAELRATASLLAVACAVSEFGKAVVSMAGGPKGVIRCYTEVPFKTRNGPIISKDFRFDGILRAKWGKKDWTAIVEVKVGNKSLDQEQFDKYHAMAIDQGINALITISNQSALANGLPPGVKPDAHQLRKVPVVHLSWERLLSEAQLLSRQKAVSDTDQQWILDEWIRYLEDEKSRIIEQPQLGDHWQEVLRYARENNLNACKNQMQDVVEHWDAFLGKVALRLRAKLGVDVVQKIPKAEKKDHGKHLKSLLDTAINVGLPGVFHIPDAAGDLSVVVLLKSRSVQYSIELEAPKEGKSTTQIKWLIKQLQSEKIPGDLFIKVNWKWGPSSQGRMKDLKERKDLKEQTDILLRDENRQKVPKEASPKSFSLQLTRGLPKGKGRSTAPVLEGIAQGIEDFYRLVVEGLKHYVPKAPQLPPVDQPEKEDASDVVSTKQPENEPVAPSTSAGCQVRCT